MLYEVILKHNIHGLCGQKNPTSVCMSEGSCTKQFPKRVSIEAGVTSDGYPKYKRRNNSDEKHFARNEKIHNGFVVPYNPYLSGKFNAHINMELCSSVKAIKYIHNI